MYLFNPYNSVHWILCTVAPIPWTIIVTKATSFGWRSHSAFEQRLIPKASKSNTFIPFSSSQTDRTEKKKSHKNLNKTKEYLEIDNRSVIRSIKFGH